MVKAMANKKPLYQPWSEEEFLSDLFVRHMTCVQRWMYRTLLQSTFFSSVRPNLPDDDNVLWMLAGCESKQQWLENMSVIRERFTSEEIRGQKVLTNKRVQADWRRLSTRRKELSEQGHRGGKASVQSKIDKMLSEAEKNYNQKVSQA